MRYVEALKRNARVANAVSQQPETIALRRRQDGLARGRRKLDSSLSKEDVGALERCDNVGGVGRAALLLGCTFDVAYSLWMSAQV
jgi:hypothetical protein